MAKVSTNAPVRPAQACSQLLAALGASDGRRKRRKRNTTPDAIGMAIKTTEVTLSMLYRNTGDPNNPHGGPMWVVSRGLARQHRQVTVFVERLDAHHRVVAPERPAVAHPPRLPHGVAAHTKAHAELEHTGEGRRRRHADHETL